VTALALVLAVAALGSSPAVAVLPVRTAAVTPDRATAIADRVAQILKYVEVDVVLMPSEAAQALRARGAVQPAECRGEAACVARLGGLLGARVVVGVGVGEFEGNVAVHLEALEVPSGKRVLVEDQILPSDLKDSMWARVLAPFGRRLLEHAESKPSEAVESSESFEPSVETGPAGPRAWLIALQADSELDALGGMITLRVGWQLLPSLTVSAGALLTGATVAGATVQARAVPFAGDFVVHPVIALEVPVLLRASPAIGVRPSLGVEVLPVPWLSLSANASYLRLVGTAPEVKPGYWLGGAEVGLRL
jgi:hypothetical protein